MPDILKITTPLVPRSDPTANKQVDPSAAFDLQNIQKVIKPEAQAGLLKQNNGMIQQDEAPTILMDMLKDPSVTVSFLKNIFMLQEIIQLLPVNNSTITKELEQLFDALLVSPEEIAAEMKRQEDTSSMFKGELFNFMRDLLASEKSPDMARSVANLLKALNSYSANKDILDAVANSLQFMGTSLEPAKELSNRLMDLSMLFRRQDAGENFRDLKDDVLSILDEVQDSILFSPKLQKVLSITIYNLSRYNDNQDFLQETITSLIIHLDNNQREEFQAALTKFFMPRDAEEQEETKSVMDVLARIIGRETSDEKINLMNSDKIERIIQSLLSSPCNFTPLLHYVIPVQFDFLKAFAEIWINPNGHEDEKKQEPDKGRDIHTLIVFDVEGIGRFEAELYVRDKVIDFSLLCPPPYVRAFEGMRGELAPVVASLDYRFGDVKIGKLDKTRSLMDVFKSLPYKRTGVNVKI